MKKEKKKAFFCHHVSFSLASRNWAVFFLTHHQTSLKVTNNNNRIRTPLAIVSLMEESLQSLSGFAADNGKNLLCVCEILRYNL